MFPKRNPRSDQGKSSQDGEALQPPMDDLTTASGIQSSGKNEVAAHLDFAVWNDSPPGILTIGWSRAPIAPSVTLTTAGKTQAANVSWIYRHYRDDVALFLGTGAHDNAGHGFAAFIGVAPDAKAIPRQISLRFEAQDADHIEAIERPVEVPKTRAAWEQFAAIWAKTQDGETASAPEPAPLPLSILKATAQSYQTVGTVLQVYVDQLLHIPGAGYLIQGWQFSLDAEAPRLYFAEELWGWMAPLDLHWHRTDRPDVAENYAYLGRIPRRCGFVALIPEPAGAVIARNSARQASTAIYALDEAGNAVTRWHLDVTRGVGPHEIMQRLLSAFACAEIDAYELMDRCIGPALTAVRQGQQVDLAKEPYQQRNFGAQPANPRISVIVSIFGAVDLMRYQMARFAADPEFVSNDIELVYVLDDPAHAKEFLRESRDMFELFGLPFRILITSCNNGFADAVNFGVAHARAPQVLLLDSDVLPEAPGWLGALASELAKPGVGAVGPRLMFNDGATQSAGLRACRHPDYPELELIESMGRGQPQSAFAASPYPVTAVSGACLLTNRERFLALGGFDRGFLFGHHEDYEFSRKLAATGLKSLLVPGISLYHLESHSRRLQKLNQPLLSDPVWCAGIEYFNLWRHARMQQEAAVTASSEALSA